MNDEYINFYSHNLKLEGYICLLPKRPVMVICHPHPQYGGTMENSVVLALRNAAWNLGIGTLRFNFRGTGNSEGEHTDGIHEIDDAISAVGYVRAQGVDIEHIYIGGYSFGAGIALKTACIDERIKKVIAVASPSHYDYEYLKSCKTPKLFILAEHDDVAHPKKISTILEQVPQKEIKIVNGTDHFFGGRLDQVEKYTKEFLSTTTTTTMYKNTCGK